MQITKSAFYQIIVFHIYIICFYLTLPYKDKWWSTLLLLTFTVALAVMEYLRTKVIASPLLLWYFFWISAISIGRMDLDLYPFYRTWEIKLVKLVLANTCIFFWFFWIGESVSSKKHKTADLPAKKNDTFGFTEITIVMLCGAIVSFVLNVIKTGVVPQLTGDANVYRESFVQTWLYKIISVLRVSYALVPIALKYEQNRNKKRTVVVLAFISILTEMLSGWRTYTFQAMIFLLTSFLIVSSPQHNRKAKKRNLRVLICFAVVGIAFIGYVAVTRDKVTGTFKEKANYLLYTLYMYIAPNFLNLQSAVENVTPVNIPVYSTEAIWGFFLNRDATLQYFGEIDQAIGTFNVSTYMLQPWGDFGSIGTYLCSAIIAFCSGATFKRCRHYPGTVSVVLLGIMNITVFVMHNNLFLRTKTVVLWLLAALVIEYYIIKKRDKQPNVPA